MTPPRRRGFVFGIHVKKKFFILSVSIGLVSGLRAQPGNGNDVLTVRSIRIEGNETTKEFVIRREMSTKQGDTLVAERIEYDKNRIYSLGLFNRVEIDYTIDGNAADLLVRVHERWYLYPFPILGIKYRDFDNVYYGVGVIHNNFRGRNERLIFSMAFGFDRWVQLTYRNPKLTADDDISLGISFSSATVQNLSPDRGFYQQSTQSFLISTGKRFGFHSVAQLSGGYEVWDVSDEIAGGTLTPGGRDEFFSVSANYAYDSRDVREYPTEGSFHSLVAAKYGFGGSAVDFFRYGYESQVFLPVHTEITLAGRTFGQFSSGGAIPAYRYVYFGYRDRIRGYFRRVLEGENIVGGTVEVHVPILSPRYYEFPYSPLPEFSVWRYGLYAAVFADAGKTWFRGEGYGGRHWYSGFGGGLHFLLPYSVVARVEYAWNPHGVGEIVLDLGMSF